MLPLQRYRETKSKTLTRAVPRVLVTVIIISIKWLVGQLMPASSWINEGMKHRWGSGGVRARHYSKNSWVAMADMQGGLTCRAESAMLQVGSSE